MRECGTPGCRNVPAASLEAFLAALKSPLSRRRDRWAACYDPVPLDLRIRKAGLSKQQAAADARMHRPTVTRVLDGRGTRQGVRRLCTVLDMELVEVVPECRG